MQGPGRWHAGESSITPNSFIGRPAALEHHLRGQARRPRAGHAIALNASTAWLVDRGQETRQEAARPRRPAEREDVIASPEWRARAAPAADSSKARSAKPDRDSLVSDGSQAPARRRIQPPREEQPHPAHRRAGGGWNAASRALPAWVSHQIRVGKRRFRCVARLPVSWV